ncbi:MAG: hypothetical protein ACRD5L_00125, partial [Bryobacteraceae bacterium]
MAEAAFFNLVGVVLIALVIIGPILGIVAFVRVRALRAAAAAKTDPELLEHIARLTQRVTALEGKLAAMKATQAAAITEALQAGTLQTPA